MSGRPAAQRGEDPVRRTVRLMLMLAVFASGLVPASGRAADDGCSLAEDRPAYVCSGAMSYRVGLGLINGRGLRVMLLGFEGNGLLAAPDVATREAGACLLISGKGSYAEMCGLPFDVTIDPLLETATIKGTTKAKPFGQIAVDVTIAAGESEPEAAPGVGGSLRSACGSASPGAGAAGLHRHGTTTGSIRVGRTTVKANGSGFLDSIASAGGIAEVSLPCAKQRASGSFGWLMFECLNAGAESYGASACRTNTYVRSAAVTGKTKTLTVRVEAYDITAATPSAPDPTWYIPPDGDPSWFTPSDTGVYRFQSLCLILNGRGFGFGSCGSIYEDEFIVDIDPALRTARLKGVIDSPFDGFYGYGSSGLPSALNFGSVSVDLTLTPKDGRPTPAGLTSSYAWGEPCGVGTVHRNTLVQGDGGAQGSIVFKRRHGALRPNAAKPLPSTMDSSISSLNFVNLGAPSCEDEMELRPA